MKDPLSDARCLVTSEEIVIDGANGVCRAPRTGGWPAAQVLGVELAIVAAIALWVAGVLPRERPASRGRRASVLLASMLVAGAPGYVALFATRADAPLSGGGTANDVRKLFDAVSAFASRASRPVAIELSRDAPCVGCEPIAWMAAPRSVPSSEARVVLGAGALGGVCHETTTTLVCGPAL